MEHILFFVILVAWCLIVARLEVEIEGKDGWAKNFPTSKYKLDESGKLWHKPFGVQDYQAPDCSKYLQKFYVFYIKMLLGGREFTGYHRTVDAMQLFVAHLVIYMLFFCTVPWWLLEIRVVSFIFLSWSIEDTFWFFLNPFYGFKKYKPEFIPWHAKDWWVFAPKGMIILFLQGCVIYLLTCAATFII